MSGLNSDWSFSRTPITPEQAKKLKQISKAKTIEIPIAQVPHGIELCKQNIADFLEDAKNIIERGKLYHAYVSFEFALEEFGKIIMLKEALSNSLGNDKITVGNELFRHDRKCDKAIEKLGNEFKSVFDMNWFLRETLRIAPLWFGTKTSHTTRTDCAFVGYKNGNWTIGARIDQIKFTKLINQLEEKARLE
jgi:AbiV family abortive infection protein